MNEALAVLLALDRCGVTVGLSPDGKGLRLAGPQYLLTAQTQELIAPVRDALIKLVADMPTGGWPCAGGCGRRSLVTEDRGQYRCWICAGKWKAEGS